MLEIKGLTVRLLFSFLSSISHNSRYCPDPTCGRSYLGEMIQQKHHNYLDFKYPKSNPITLITSNSLRPRIFHRVLPHYMNPILLLLPHQTRPRASITTPFPDLEVCSIHSPHLSLLIETHSSLASSFYPPLSLELLLFSQSIPAVYLFSTPPRDHMKLK